MVAFAACVAVPGRWGGEPPTGGSPSCMAATSSATSSTFFFSWPTISRASPVWPFEQASLPVLAVFAILDGRRTEGEPFINDPSHDERGRSGALFQQITQYHEVSTTGRALLGLGRRH